MSLSYPTGRSADKGFTLIELLVAVALTAVLLTGLYASFFSVYRAATGVERTLTVYIDAGRFLDAFTRDVNSAYFVPGDPAASFEGGLHEGASFVSFTTMSAPAGRGPGRSGGFVKVSYTFERPGERSGASGRIYREVTNLYTLESYGYEVTGPVTSLDMSYYGGAEWARAWDSALENSAPASVRVSIKLENGDELFATANTMAKPTR